MCVLHDSGGIFDGLRGLSLVETPQCIDLRGERAQRVAGWVRVGEAGGSRNSDIR
jgi:hypothetical protein